MELTINVTDNPEYDNLMVDCQKNATRIENYIKSVISIGFIVAGLICWYISYYKKPNTAYMPPVQQFPPEDGKQRAQRVEKRRGGNSGNTLTVLSQFPLTRCHFMASMASKEASANNASHAPVAYIIHADKIVEDDDKIIPFNWIHFEGRNAEEEAKMIDYIDTKEWRSKAMVSVEMEKPYRRNLEVLMHRADVLFFSKVFAEGKGYNDAGNFLQIMAPFCKNTAYLFCTWGSSGAMCYHNPTQMLYNSPAFPIPNIVDSVGAGDTFIAGVIYGLTQELSPDVCLKFACELAGRKCAQIGFNKVVERMGKLF
ncbi:3081_t:CDS:2 [Entrophospora sp. SA101]|nr:3081_t:CDS:2 [Entrophospora sp. SA101]